jgi:hypothetical protein
VSERAAVGGSKSWQELKGRITALRRELHKTPLGLIGSPYWVERIRELEECQRKLELLKAPSSLRPPEQPSNHLVVSVDISQLHENEIAQSYDRLKRPKINWNMS